MLSDDPQVLLPLIALYPEIHYRFKAFPLNRYFRSQPEIIADAPFRLEPGHALPVLLLVKDSDRFPIILEGVNIEAQGREQYFRRHFSFGRELICKRWWHHIEWVELPDESDCTWEINVTWRVQIADRHYNITNDNLPGLSHGPLKVRQSGQSLPRKDGWIFGDLHAHTSYTEDQVEFGAPLDAYYHLGQACGLSFSLTADHSYDLDDLPGSFNENDPNLTRFKFRSAEIARLNRDHQGAFSLIPGCELSVANDRGRNVHLLLLNQREFLPGSGDSAERWFHTRAEFSIDEVIKKLKDEVLAVAAHPLMKPPLLQRLFLKRGSWKRKDLYNEKISALQIWNGQDGKDFRKGIETWVKGLLRGKRWKILAGSDAHGNFNRYRQVGFAMLRLKESNQHIFGQVRTGVRLAGNLSPDNLTNSLKSAPSLVTDGPFAHLELKSQQDGSMLAQVEASSTSEFGELSTVRLYWGNKGEKAERILQEGGIKGGYSATLYSKIEDLNGYLRVEAITNAGRRALTNPLFLNGQTV